MIRKINPKRKNKKALSVMVGYVLLITFAIILSGIVYTYLKSYVPRDAIECPEDTSIYIKELTCPSANTLNLTIKNTGKFNIAGFFIRATTNINQELATTDLSVNLYPLFKEFPYEFEVISQGIYFDSGSNFFSLNQEYSVWFNLESVDEIYAVEIIPIILGNLDKGRPQIISCGNAKVREELSPAC